ncbi:MAG: GNAT family N-acetyltransferase [Anaerolineales bacterium]
MASRSLEEAGLVPGRELPAMLAETGAAVPARIPEGLDVAATSCAVLHDRAVGIYNVATLAENRGRGLGAALTTAAVVWGGSEPARRRRFSRPPMGLGIYTRLGFRTIVSYSSWNRPGP